MRAAEPASANAVMTPKSYGTSGRIKNLALDSGSSASAKRLFTRC